MQDSQFTALYLHHLQGAGTVVGTYLFHVTMLTEDKKESVFILTQQLVLVMGSFMHLLLNHKRVLEYFDTRVYIFNDLE